MKTFTVIVGPDQEWDIEGDRYMVDRENRSLHIFDQDKEVALFQMWLGITVTEEEE